MKKEKRSKITRIFTFILMFLIITIVIFFSNREKIIILISHLSHKNELRFVEQFLNDFKKYEFENPNVKKYFLDDEAPKLLEMMIYYDNNLQKRDYIIGTIASNENYPNDFLVSLATKEKGKILDWIQIIMIKKSGKYYVKKFQLMENFPGPPNVWD